MAGLLFWATLGIALGFTARSGWLLSIVFLAMALAGQTSWDLFWAAAIPAALAWLAFEIMASSR